MTNGSGQQEFLAGLYLNHFAESTFNSFATPLPEPEAEQIIGKIQALNNKYPAAALEKQGAIPDKLWHDLKSTGLFGLNIPKEYGGVGLSLSGYLKILQSLASVDLGLAIIPTAHLSIGVKGILLFGNEEQKKLFLPKAASGEMIFAYALTEPKTGSDARHITTTATLSDDGKSYILNGTKTYITNGGYAGGLVVFAQMDPASPGHMGALIVETTMAGVKIGRDMDKMGLKISSTTAITFKNVRVPTGNLLGQPGDGFKIAMSILNYGRLGLGAASTGVMEISIAEMIARASARVQFGKPIKEYELIQEKIVRAEVHLAVARAMTEFTAHLLSKDPLANVAIESSHTKLFSTTRAWETLYDALQTAGGAGYLSSLPYEKRMRDFRVTTIFEGTTEIHSIYPPLLLLRQLGQGRKTGRIASLLTMLRKMVEYPTIELDFRDSTMKKGISFIRKNSRLVRLMLLKGAIRHGRKITEKELLLTRITSLSLHTYGVLALLAIIESRRKQGADIRHDLNILAWFIEESEKVRQQCRHLLPDRQEKLHHLIFDEMDRKSIKDKDHD